MTSSSNDHLPASGNGSVHPVDAIYLQNTHSPVTVRTGGNGQGTGENVLHHYVAIALRRWKLIFVVASILVFVVGLYSFLSPRLYSATANVKIGSYAPVLPGEGMEDFLRSNTREKEYLNTQVDQLRSLSLADRVLSESEYKNEIVEYLLETRPQLKGFLEDRLLAANDLPDAEYQYPLAMLKSYLGMIYIEPVFKTSIVRVSATSIDRNLSTKIANTHASTFIDHARAERQKLKIDTLVFLRQQAADLEARVSDAERKLGEYAEEHAIITLKSNEHLVMRQMSEISEKLTEATNKRVKTEAALKEAKDGFGLKSNILDDDSIRELRMQLQEAKAQHAELSSKFQPTYPKLRQLKARIEGLTESLKRGREGAIRALEAEYNASKASEERLTEKLESFKKEAFELSGKQVEYNSIKRELDSTNDLYQNVLRQLKEAQLSAENPASNIIVSDFAAVPDYPSAPKRKLNLLLALGFGPMLGFGIALLVEMFDHSFRDAADVEDELGLPLLGFVPEFDLNSDQSGGHIPKTFLPDGSSEKSTTEDRSSENESAEKTDSKESSKGKELVDFGNRFVTVKSPRSVSAEAFQTIRTGLMLSTPDSPPKLMLATSATKNEGKTTLISNLAVSMAQALSKTVLIDCDLRRPVLHKRFGLNAKVPGLSDYLAGQATLEEIASETPVSNLSVIPAGSSVPNPAALIGSQKMVELLQILCEQYEFVLLDSPPVLPVADALMLSRLGAGVILVVHGKQTRRKIVREAKGRLRQARANVLGVVVNHSNQLTREYYDEYTAEDDHFEILPGEEYEQASGA